MLCNAETGDAANEANDANFKPSDSVKSTRPGPCPQLPARLAHSVLNDQFVAKVSGLGSPGLISPADHDIKYFAGCQELLCGDS